MKMKNLVIMILAFWVTTSTSSFAETSEPNQEMMQQLQAQISAAVEKLDLSGEDFEQFKAILEKSFKERSAILEKYGLETDQIEEKLGFRQIRKMRNDLAKIQQATEKELSKILTPEQMEVWKTFASENSKEMRKKISSGMKGMLPD